MEIELTADEAYFIEKLCDSQAVVISGKLPLKIEQFLLMRATIKNDTLLKFLMTDVLEWAESSALLKSIRDKFESKRNAEIPSPTGGN